MKHWNEEELNAFEQWFYWEKESGQPEYMYPLEKRKEILKDCFAEYCEAAQINAAYGLILPAEISRFRFMMNTVAFWRMLEGWPK